MVNHLLHVCVIFVLYIVLYLYLYIISYCKLVIFCFYSFYFKFQIDQYKWGGVKMGIVCFQIFKNMRMAGR